MIYGDGMICIPSSKHISVLVKKFEDMDGRPAKIYKTPGFDNLCCEELSPVLNEKDASEYRSVVGLVMYASHVCVSIQNACKLSVLEAYTDSDWQGGPNATSACCLFLNGQLLAGASQS